MRFNSLLLALGTVVLSSCSHEMARFFISEADITRLVDDGSFRHLTECRDPLNYAPDPNHYDHTPMRYVRVNLHFMNNADSTSNFNPDEGIGYAKHMVWQANWSLWENQKMRLPIGNNTPVLTSRFEYKIVPDSGDTSGIYFHYDSTFAFYNKVSRRGLFSSEIYDIYGKRKNEAINIILQEHPTDSIASPTYKASSDGVGMGKWMKLIGCFQKNTELLWVDTKGDSIFKGSWRMAKGLSHELGHCLGLSHTWNTNDGCDDTPRNANCWNVTDQPPCDTAASTNLMDYNQNPGALTPCQLGKIHYNFSRDGVQRKMLEPTWCTYNPDATITIGQGDTVKWPCSKDLEGDIIIENGASLTMYCTISMPAGSRIVVKPGGRLELNGCTLTNRCGDNWLGIEAHEFMDIKAEVAMLNNARVENVVNEIGVERKLIEELGR